MSSPRLHRLATYYLAGRLYRARPRTILFSPTLRCNLKCVHCGIWKEKAEVPTYVDPPRWETMLGDPVFAEVDNLWLGGGEPTLVAAMTEYYRNGWQRLPRLERLGLITNGFLTSKLDEAVRSLLSSMPDAIKTLYVHLSVDGPEAVHDTIRGVPGAHRQLMRALERLEEIRKGDGRLVILLNCVIQPANATHLEETRAWAAGRGIHLSFNLLSLTDGFYCNTENADRLAFTPAALNKVLAFARQVESESPWPMKGHYQNVVGVLEGRGRGYRCVAMESTFHLDGDGRVWACPASSEKTVGNVMNTAPGDIWNGLAFRDIRKEVRREVCDGCALSCSIGDGMNWSEAVGA